MTHPQIILLAVALVWVICGVLAYGITLAHLQRSFPDQASANYREDCVLALLVALLGPWGCAAAIFTTGFGARGLMFRRPRKAVQS